MKPLAASYALIAKLPPALFPVTAGNTDILARFVSLADRADPFARSAAYYAMTGRKGLWIYADEDTAAIMARHPNRDGHTLIFPPVGQEPAGLVRKALHDPRLPPGKLELARIGPDDSALVRQLGGRRPSPETVLDWAYPIHVISPEKVIAREGKPFVSLRGHINRAARDGLTAEAIDIPAHRAEITAVVKQWAGSKTFGGYTAEDLVDPTLAVLDLADAGTLSLCGTLTRDAAGEPVGFWLWERAQNAAISLARVALRRPGNAELGILATCEQVRAAGLPEMALGGSESADLDTFKRKMQPIRSIPLQTLNLISAPANDLAARLAV